MGILDDGVHLNKAGNCLLYFSYKAALQKCQLRLSRAATNRRRGLLSRRASWPSRQRAVRNSPRTLPY